ncbi:PadR family transcriptional regulator [Chitinophaga pendula]|uniref:PadR family transcriptional regulator n=1 Tax=Chitinophaga TaxID=79328 RepID=UPI000BAEAF37|nr:MULTISPECIES: PadR family transcriptional regulator [Chitinophaga]ASZ12978.1 PadR family transcriptional regulator [Chitinophaga sp. MD30]UCJ09390.1 PadR family transcriptional regulator [Chitinophaga pendula]
MDKEYISNWTSQLKKGVLPYIILKLLNNEAYYGYELIKEIKNVLNTGVTDGTLYPILNRMHKDGLLRFEWVEQGSGIPRKYYYLTDSGKDTLVSMSDVWSVLSRSIKQI